MRASLEKATGELRALEAKLGATRVQQRQVARVPTVEEIAGLVLDVEERIHEDPTSAREALGHPLDPPDCWAPFEGRITVGWE